MPNSDAIVIVGAARTPMGGFLGDFKDVAAPKLGATAIRAALSRAGLNGEDVDEALMGCVLPAGLGQAPARQAALGAGLPIGVGATTVNKMCGSGMKAAMLAHDLIRAGSAKIVVAGGMESMSNAPYLLERARAGYRMGHGRVVDHMFLDGLEDAYDKGRLMGTFAEDCAQSYQFTREAQDAFALRSLERAMRAMREGDFAGEIEPVAVKSGKSEAIVAADEQPPKARPEKIPPLKPAFRDGGTVTAANSSSISDGAAALILMRRSEAERRGVKPLATHRRPRDLRRRAAEFPHRADRRDAPTVREDAAGAPIRSICSRSTRPSRSSRWRRCAISTSPHDKVNVNGGACALGHPIGASGARILVTLLAALQARGLERGVASLCIGGGEATAMAIERAR